MIMSFAGIVWRGGGGEGMGIEVRWRGEGRGRRGLERVDR